MMLLGSFQSIFRYEVIDGNTPGTLWYYINVISWGIWEYARVAFASLLFIRFFLLYFDIRHNKLISNQEWRSVIDSNHSSKMQQSFFVKYKQPLGTTSFWFKLFAVDSLFIIGLIVVSAITLSTKMIVKSVGLVSEYEPVSECLLQCDVEHNLLILIILTVFCLVPYLSHSQSQRLTVDHLASTHPKHRAADRMHVPPRSTLQSGRSVSYFQ